MVTFGGQLGARSLFSGENLVKPIWTAAETSESQPDLVLFGTFEFETEAISSASIFPIYEYLETPAKIEFKSRKVGIRLRICNIEDAKTKSIGPTSTKSEI